MLKILETAKAKLEALEAKGISEVREVIEHLKEAIGIHKAATEEPQPAEGASASTDAAGPDAATAQDLGGEGAATVTS